MTNYKIRILRIYRSCSLKNQVIIAVKISLNFTVAVVYAVYNCFYCICMVVIYFYITVYTCKSHCSIKTNLLFFIKLICSCKAENIRCIKFSIAVSVKVAVYIFYKWTLNKKVKTGYMICTNCISVYIVYQVCKVHCHCIKLLNFITDINITKFYKGSKLSAGENCIFSCIFPYKLVVA